MSESTHADIRLFLVVHETFRRALRMITDAVGVLRPDDTAQARRVQDRWVFFERSLTHHHEGEDATVFPALVRHLPSFDAFRTELHADHEVVAAEMRAVDEAFAAVPRRCDAAAIAALHASLETLTATLVPHLDREDAEVLPLVAANVPAGEWDDIGESLMQSLPKADLGLAVGGLDDLIRTLPDADRPPPPPLPVRMMLALVWRRRWRAFLAPLRVTPS
jgi:hemerythrin-like domain-containing protein